ncbi:MULTISPECIES: hypothetical protein [unclassified Photobacterium]|uniref:hypothetical protein n=1 Tax=unclassified Photobacterium TaxID=2628852 RepID=UPI000D162E8E|nr:MULTISPECIES: hypothetical protein [unclassified Photobacterium]PSV27197.1 hypothetical protein C9J40_20515 [Photobacterium sp. GB-72]PSV32176.1 hypothetical protein C9J44_19155 [Photobacterium sp. GB-27]PSV34446.1 hypothetical protein C9J38_18020 [Photobacterium sp. GB-210]PSV50993.1 hypothetical protein C9J45_17465 [Photobacterium sp. GB-1]PSV53498.1 hypothetical protein C9J43_18995 [Photobacterium sp. GB-3]
MPFYIILIAVIFFCSGCVALYPAQWQAITVIDELTGEPVCRVRAISPMQTDSSYYPIVDMVHDQVRVGMHSPDQNPLPVGDIQLQVDSHYRWLIKQRDMPYYLQQQMDITPHILIGYDHYLSHMNMHQRDELQHSFSTVTAKALASRSPYTVATGDAAKSLFNQMLTGEFLEYRIFQTPLHGLTVGRYPLAHDYLKALQTCGIDWYP